MAGMTAASSIAAATHTKAFSELQESVWYNNEVMPLFPKMAIPGGGSTFNVKHHTAANTSIAKYSEGDAVGAPGSETYATAQWPVQYYKGVIQITGHARDYLKDGNPDAAFFNQVAGEFTGVMKQVIDTATDDMQGTGLTAPTGIQGIIDSAGTVASVNRTSATWFQAHEAAIAGSATALSDVDILWQNVHGDSGHKSPGIDLIITGYTQRRILKVLAGQLGVSNNSFGINPSGVGLDIGVPTLAYEGAPVVQWTGLNSASVLLMLHSPDWLIAEMRSLRVEPLAKTDDSDKFLATWAGGLVCKQPKYQAKLTGVV